MQQSIHLVYSYRRALLGGIVSLGFATLYLAARLFGDEGMDMFFAGTDREALHSAGHIVIYGSLAVLLAKSLRGRFFAAWLVSVVLATGEEFHQMFVPGRVSSIEDAVLNIIAITFFISLAGLLHIGLGQITLSAKQRSQPLAGIAGSMVPARGV